MLKQLLAVVVGLGLVAVLAGGALAADEAKTETVKGVVSVVKAEDGKVTVTLKAGDVVYSVAGEKAKELEGMDKKSVEVTGTVAEKDGKKTVTVASVKAVEATK
ncbi:MAG TPA: hypothetical protein PK280_19995 [Planctomycetota bacterium]|nr:hypothetical protein [Planctomycetota bacterium]